MPPPPTPPPGGPSASFVEPPVATGTILPYHALSFPQLVVSTFSGLRAAGCALLDSWKPASPGQSPPLTLSSPSRIQLK